MLSDDMEQCEGDDCTNRATAVYEGVVPPAGTARYKACWNCSPNIKPVRYIHPDTKQ